MQQQQAQKEYIASKSPSPFPSPLLGTLNYCILPKKNNKITGPNKCEIKKTREFELFHNENLVFIILTILFSFCTTTKNSWQVVTNSSTACPGSEHHFLYILYTPVDPRSLFPLGLPQHEFHQCILPSRGYLNQQLNGAAVPAVAAGTTNTNHVSMCENM